MEMIIESKTYGTHTVFYDDQDYSIVNRFKWAISKGKNGVFYARGFIRKKDREEIGQKTVRMHRIIMGALKDQEVDHVDHNGLNNKRNNLRFASNSQNTANTRLHIDSKTGFKGVTFREKKELYIPRIRVNGVLIHGKLTKNIYNAALQYNQMAVKYFGEYANINNLTEEQIKQASIKIPHKRIIKSNTTGYRGVCIGNGSTKNPYVATIRIDRKNKYLGSFPTANEAAQAYNDAVIMYNKPSEWLNEISNE